MHTQAFNSARILIVDDEPANVRLLERMLETAGYLNRRSTTDPRQVPALYAEFQPDLILLDLMMPYLNGFAVIEQLRRHIAVADDVAILLLTADSSQEIKERALALGATGFLTKPFERVELLLRLQSLLEQRSLNGGL